MQPNIKKPSVKSNNEITTIVRVVHNRENPFVQLNKKSLWDKNLSNHAIGLWARLMSKPDDWHFNMENLIADLPKDGRKSHDSALKELMEQGYVVRYDFYEKDEKGRFKGKVSEYVVFEFPADDADKRKVYENLQCVYRNCRFGNFRKGKIGSLGTYILHTEKEITKNSLPLTPSTETEETAAPKADALIEDPPPLKEKAYSPEVVDLTARIIEKLQSHNPEWRKPSNLKKVYDTVHLMLKNDDRKPETVMEILEYALNDNVQRGSFNGWFSIIYGKNPVEKLRKHFPTIYAQTLTKKTRRFGIGFEKNEIKENANIQRWLTDVI